MVCHNYRRVPAVMLAKQLIDEGRPRASSTTSAAPTCRTGSPIRSSRWSGGCRRRRPARVRSATSPPTRSTSRGSSSARSPRWPVRSKTFVKERPLPDNPKRRKGTRHRGRCASASVVRFANGALGTIEASRFAHGAQELQPLRDQRQQGSHRVRPGADERARALSSLATSARRRASATILVTEAVASVHQGLVAARPHHRLRAHVHPHGLRPARGHGEGQAAQPELRGRRAQPAGARGHGEVRRDEAVGDGLARGHHECRVAAGGRERGALRAAGARGTLGAEHEVAFADSRVRTSHLAQHEADTRDERHGSESSPSCSAASPSRKRWTIS